MTFSKLVPNIFYSDINTGLRLFAECLQFQIVYQEPDAEHPLYVLEKDGLGVHLIEDTEYAEKDRPEFRLVTDNIEAVYKKIDNGFSDLLHPNASRITRKPWGAKEFALKDPSDVCVIIQQWQQ